MKKRILTCCIALLLSLVFCCPAFAASDIPQLDTPNYRVAFYAFDCYNMQDETGTRSGYGYDMMQGLSKYLQCTFSYVGYEKTAAECLDMLRSGELDIYTAAKLTPERIAEFAVSTHPAITATTCMNVKVGNSHVVAGDYSTYNGLRIGLLQRHTYAVFMDMQMPVMDGVEATKQIRASSRPDHNVPIFAMTANTFASDRKRCFDAGMSGYIAKPINLLEITTTLHRTAVPQAV